MNHPENSSGNWHIVAYDTSFPQGGHDLIPAQTFITLYGIAVQPGEVKGIVYKDLDRNGSNDSELGLAGVVVTASDENGTTASTSTSSDGSYLIPTSAGLSGDVRIEFTLPTDGSLDSYEPTIAGSTTVQFVNVDSGATGVDMGYHRPLAMFCDPSVAEYVVSCFSNGDPTHNSNSSETAIAKFDYLTSGTVQSDANNNSYAQTATIGGAGGVGNVWGLAYDHLSGRLYSAAVVKRHAGATSDGIGAIYMQSDVTDPSSTSLFFNFGAAVGSIDNNATRFPGNGNAFGEEGPCRACDNIDSNAFPWPGTIGLGGIDLSEDGSVLYAVNLNDHKLYHINTTGTPTASEVTGAPWVGNSDCTDGVARPWAVNEYEESVYVGAICDASSSSCTMNNACTELTAHIYEYDTNTGAWSTAMPGTALTYQRDLYADGRGTIGQSAAPLVAGEYWHPWVNDYGSISNAIQSNNRIDPQYPQPILVDINFADDGSLVLGFADRSSWQFGYQAPSPTDTNAGATSVYYFTGGDILRANYNHGSGQYELDANPAYYDDRWYLVSAAPNGFTTDSGTGGLATLPGAGSVIFGESDPLDAFAAGSVFMSTDTGSHFAAQEVYDSGSSLPLQGGGFAKSGGIGDIEMICPIFTVPIQVGNRVWNDIDGDGLQDPGEAGIDGVDVTIMCTGPAFNDTVTTSNNGHYLFNNVPSDATCTISIATSQGPLNNLSLTASNADAQTNNGNQNDLRDSDASMANGSAQVVFTVGSQGQNNHTFDFGFTELPEGTIQIVKNTVRGNDSFTFSSDDSDLNAVVLATNNGIVSSTIITKTAGIYTVTEDALTG